MKIYNKMNKKCFSSSMSSYQLKVIHHMKQLNISENVFYLMPEGIEIEGQEEEEEE